MSRRSKQLWLLSAIFAMVAVGVCLSPHDRQAVLSNNQSTPREVTRTFATMRSSRHQSTEDIEVCQWREALSAADRCAAFGKLIQTRAVADRALQWATAMENESSRNMARQAITCAWAKSEPEAAVQWALTEEDPTAKAAEIMTVFSTWVAQNPKAASAYVTALPQAEQTYGIAAVAPTLADSNPQDAMRWAQSLDEEDARNLATHYVVTTWASNKPEDAAAWALTQPDGFDRADNVRTIVEKWLLKDANAAVKWVRALPAGTSRDTAIDLIAGQFTDSDPTFAANWAQAIERTELRNARLEAVGSKSFDASSQDAPR